MNNNFLILKHRLINKINRIKKCKNTREVFMEIKGPKKLKEKLMRRTDKTYTIAELNTMINFYNAQKDMISKHLIVTEWNDVLTSFVSNNKMRIPTAARVDIANSASVISSIINQQLADINAILEGLNIRKNALLMEIADIYGVSMPDSDSALIDEYNKEYNDFIATYNAKVDGQTKPADNIDELIVTAPVKKTAKSTDK